VKKLISIGVALALVAIVVLPLGVAAQPPGCPDIGNDTYPQTFAKIPFAILQSGLDMVAKILGPLAGTLGIPTWVADVVNIIAPWAGGPLSWTVDMLGWGVATVGSILGPLATTLGLPEWLPGVVNVLACALFTPYTCITSNNLSLNCT
jgi:hypothetical protein